MESILTKRQESVKQRPVKTGRKTTYIRWTLTNASKEFGVNQETIAKRLKAGGIMPGDDGYYSTKQIATAVYGDLERERIGLTAAERISQETKNRVEAGELVDVADFRKDYAPIYVEMVRLIRGSGMADEQQDKLLMAMDGLHAKETK